MLLLLSSAAAPRYKQDIIRALAMPVGAPLQFRYKFKWIDQGLHDLVKANRLRGRQACIAYIDQSQPGTVPEIAPVRAATFRGSEVQGDFCVVELELAGFAFVQDVKAFNKQLRTQCTNLPDWARGSSHPKGNYCEEIETKKLARDYLEDSTSVLRKQQG